MISDDARAVETPVTEPPKLWRNWWRIVADDVVYPDADWWPTKEICEQKAEDEIAWDEANLIGDDFDDEEWEGAYPEGERP